MRNTREAEVLARLDHVTDPELDESVTELGFVTSIEIEDSIVHVAFRLPTYWCASNFAWMMADDMRREVGALPWVTRVIPRLGEHMYADKINDGVAAGMSFQEAMGDEASGNLDELRQTFLIKAFQRRQEALLRYLIDTDLPAGDVVDLTLDGLEALPLDTAGSRLRDRYVERRALAGPDALAFVDATGHPLTPDGLKEYLRGLRRIGTNAEFNGALCSALLTARFGDDTPDLTGEPTLLDFARMGPSRSHQ